MTKRYLIVGETYPLTLGWSEVCMHMRVADKTMPVTLTEHGARIRFSDHEGAYSPVTHGEASIYTDYRGAYWVESTEHSSLKRCATIACDNAASVDMEWTDHYHSDAHPHQESVCRECADSYLARPALSARELIANTRESE